MLRVLTDGKVKIGAYKFSDRKKPCLCIAEGKCIREWTVSLPTVSG